MPEVKFKIGADGSGAKAALEGINKQVKGLASTAGSLGSSLKGGLAGVFGVATIGGLVAGMASFSDEISNASDRLGIATDRVQSFRIAAKHAGMDLGAFDKIFLGMEKTFGEALGGGSEMDVLKKFGLSKDDVAHLNKADALTKILEGSTKMSDQASREGLSQIFGGKSANALMAMRGDILDGNKDRIVSDDALSQVDALGDAMEDLKDTVIEGLIPSFLALVKFLQEKVYGFSDDTKTGNKLHAEASALYMNKYGKDSENDSILNSMNYQSEVIGANLFASGDEKKEALKKAQKEFITKAFGADIYEDLMKDFEAPASMLDDLNAKMESRRKERKAQQDLLRGNVSRSASGNRQTLKTLLLGSLSRLLLNRAYTKWEGPLLPTCPRALKS